MILKLLKSRQFWTIIVLIIINGVSSVRDLLPANILPIIDLILGVLAVYFRVKPVQDFQA
jgi:hypothetical protein